VVNGQSVIESESGGGGGPWHVGVFMQNFILCIKINTVGS